MKRRSLAVGGTLIVGVAAALFVTTTGPSAVAAGASAIVQSPIDGSVTSAPGEHTPVFEVPEAGGESGDAAMDIGAPEGTSVFPTIQYDGEGGLVLTVADILESCTGGGGGDAVQVHVATDGLVVGSVIYAHLAEVAVTEGQTVSSDTQLGKVAGGLPEDENCWTGPHVHLEWVNHGDYGCYIPRAEGDHVALRDPVGQVGGDFGDGQGIVCP